MCDLSVLEKLLLNESEITKVESKSVRLNSLS